MRWLLSRQEGIDDAHAATAARARMLGCFWLFGLGAGVLDGIDRDEWYCEQLADTRDIAGAGLACEKAVVADAVKALRQHVHRETADELMSIKRHLASAGGEPCLAGRPKTLYGRELVKNFPHDSSFRLP